MAGVTKMPLALFVTASNMSIQAINQRLEQLEFDGVAYLWLVTSMSYTNAPQKRADNLVNEGTHPPITAFTSPFAGHSITEAAEWLKQAPQEVDLDRNFFGFLDDYSEEDDTVQLCRIGEDGEVRWYPAKPSGAEFAYKQDEDFESDLMGYIFKQRRVGKPDRSSG